ncbi:MAG TPA: LiaF domain-containing protein [Polyangiaceae bacterium]|nr:LiaF domain-containing protein [Polyangiaceae bacterium]
MALRHARDRALERLSESFARDELSLDEFERRIDRAYASSAEAELDVLVADLSPAAPSDLARMPPAPLPLAAGRSPRPRLALAVFGNVERRVNGDIASGATVSAVFGNVELDLRELVLPPGVTELHVRAVFGNIELTLPPTIAVECDGTPVFGSFASLDRRPSSAAGEPVLRIVGGAVFGNVEIRTLPSRLLLEAHHGRRRLGD